MNSLSLCRQREWKNEKTLCLFRCGGAVELFSVKSQSTYWVVASCFVFESFVWAASEKTLNVWMNSSTRCSPSAHKYRLNRSTHTRIMKKTSIFVYLSTVCCFLFGRLFTYLFALFAIAVMLPVDFIFRFDVEKINRKKKKKDTHLRLCECVLACSTAM